MQNSSEGLEPSELQACLRILLAHFGEHARDGPG